MGGCPVDHWSIVFLCMHKHVSIILRGCKLMQIINCPFSVLRAHVWQTIGHSKSIKQKKMKGAC